MSELPWPPNPNRNQTGNHDPDTSGSFKIVTRASTRPKHMPVSIPTPVPSELVPTDLSSHVIDTDPSTEESLAARGEIPEIKPVFLGLRNRRIQRRIDGLQARIEELGRRQPTQREIKAQFIGRSIIRGEGYRGHTQPLRPVTVSERLTAKALEKLSAGSKRRVAVALKAADDFTDKQEWGETGQFTPNFDKPGMTRKEDKDNRLHGRRYDRFQGEIDRRGRAFAWVISPRQANARRLSQKRDELMLKRQAIENAQHGRPRDWRPEITPQAQQVQYGSPDSRGKVTLGTELRQPGAKLDLHESQHTRGQSREVIIYTEDGHTLYLRGTDLYSWGRDAAGQPVFNKLKLPEPSPRDAVLPLAIGRVWPVTHVVEREIDDSATRTKYGPQPPKRTEEVTIRSNVGGQIERVVVLSGNLSAQAADDAHLPHRQRNPFDSARRVARQIDSRQSSPS